MSRGTSLSKMPVWVGSMLYTGLRMEVGRRRGGWLVLVRMCVLGSGRLHSTCNACVGSGYVQYIRESLYGNFFNNNNIYIHEV